jgi:hypothetical protein
VQVSPRAFAEGAREQEAGEMSLQGTAIEEPAAGTPVLAELKTIYYNQMIRFHKQSNNYIEIVRCLLAMYADVKNQRTDQWAPLLKQIVWYVFRCRGITGGVCRAQCCNFKGPHQTICCLSWVAR